MQSIPDTALQLQSLVKAEGELVVSLARVPVPIPRANEVLIRVEASPINPSDIGLLFATADLRTLRRTGDGACAELHADIPAIAVPHLSGRIGEPMAVGNEGAGRVVAAGSSPSAQALSAQLVSVMGGGMYAQYRCVPADHCLLLPEGLAAVDGASAFINPLTALGMVETMRREGHTALIHTAAASNLGQMLLRVCQVDGIPLVTIVRTPQQAKLLRDQGARYVIDTWEPGWQAVLTAAITETGATLAFDAVGGGSLASDILWCMETAIERRGGNYSRYGSNVMKQVYLYGNLDSRPTEIVRNFGTSWRLGGWLLFSFMQQAGPEVVRRLQRRVASELTTTFVSHYAGTLSLSQMLDPDVVATYVARGTGAKYLLQPWNT